MDRLDDEKKFEQINRFVQTVLDDETAGLVIPHDAGVIQVASQGRRLPLEHLGTGIHQVVILAAAATLIKNSLVCIEDPEVHLHPLLQRKLLKYIAANTDN